MMQTSGVARRFLRALKTGVAVGGILLSLALRTTLRASPDSPAQKKAYLVATSHLDTQWRWTIQTTIRDYIPNTLRGNFALLQRYPEYVFNFEGAFRYMLAKEYYPQEYARMADYIRAGRWQVTGSFVDACDVNIPSPESLIRQALYGNGFFQKEFGKTSCDIFLPDCFGFGYALPSIARHCGLLGFSTQKLTWGSSVGIPFDIGLWQGVDGHTLIAALDPGAYVSDLTQDQSRDSVVARAIDRQWRRSGLSVAYRYYGTGDVGGAPSEGSVQWLENSLHSDGPITVVSATADQLYRELSPEQQQALPRYNGELLMSTHGTGCYTSQAAMKRWNRKNELLANAAERAAVVADWFGAARYPKEKLKDAWVRFLWHQFHDDLTGTSIPEAYEFSWNDEIISANQFAAVLEHSVAAASRGLDTRVTGLPILVYNPLSFDRQDVVEITVPREGEKPYARIFDRGREVPSQVLSATATTLRMIFLARAPSVGFQVYSLRYSDTPYREASDLHVSASRLENKRYRLTLNAQGQVVSIRDKKANRELLSAPLQLQLLNNTSIDWPAWEVIYKDLSVPPRAAVDSPAQVSVVENGPVRVCLRITQRKDSSTFIQNISLAAGEAGDQVLFSLALNWNTRGTLLKAAFPLSVRNDHATYDLGVGAIARPTNSEKLYEVPAQQWADLTDAGGEYGVAVFNDCKYGWDKPDDHTLRLTLLHTPTTGSGFQDQSAQDLGCHQMAYGLMGHAGPWQQSGVVQQAGRLNQPLIAFLTGRHSGCASELSFASLDTDQILIHAIKQAEASDEIVVRLCECSGRPVEQAALKFYAPVQSARELNGSEAFVAPLNVHQGALHLSFAPYQLRTIAVRLADPPQAVQSVRCQPVDLPFTLDAFSSNEDRSDGDLDGNGACFPSELISDTVLSEEVVFKMGSTAPGSLNALACKGQTLTLPAGGYNRLHLLAASRTEDVSCSLLVEGRPHTWKVQSFRGNIGQWDSRLVDGSAAEIGRLNGVEVETFSLTPGFIKTDRIAWVATHSHTPGGDVPYKFCYLFRYDFPLAENVRTVALPNQEEVVVFAATCSREENGGARALSPLFDQFPDNQVAIVSAENALCFVDKLLISLVASPSQKEVRYTLDGSEPGASSLLYQAPFFVDRTTLVKACAFDPLNNAGPVASKRFFQSSLRPAVAASDGDAGVCCSYYEGVWKWLPNFPQLSPIRTAVLPDFSLPDQAREDHFAVLYTAMINIPADGFYTFYTRSDDGSALWIGDVKVVDNDGSHGADEKAGLIGLAAGWHPITVHYFEDHGEQSLQVSYAGPGIPKQIIPAERLRQRP
ncbi:MAG TPA: glycoside hydrolase family 38 C-terminal domain-containing protein [bacterium]|nr:glycoside hydrolase family 38 C-terminal domain-containing protein [bacterium]